MSDMKPSERIWEHVGGEARVPFTLFREDRDALEQELDAIIRSIASRQTLADAEGDLHALADIHGVLAVLRYRYEADLTERQREILYEFDRHDVPEVKENMFERIRRGDFSRARHSE